MLSPSSHATATMLADFISKAMPVATPYGGPTGGPLSQRSPRAAKEAARLTRMRLNAWAALGDHRMGRTERARATSRRRRRAQHALVFCVNRQHSRAIRSLTRGLLPRHPLACIFLSTRLGPQPGDRNGAEKEQRSCSSLVRRHNFRCNSSDNSSACGESAYVQPPLQLRGAIAALFGRSPTTCHGCGPLRRRRSHNIRLYNFTPPSSMGCRSKERETVPVPGAASWQPTFAVG